MTATIEQLGEGDAAALKTLLLRDTPHNLYLLGLCEEFGATPVEGGPALAVYGRFEGRELTAALFVGGDGGLVVPSACSVQEATDLAESLMGKVKLRACLGDPPVVDVLTRHLAAGRPKFVRNQRLFTVSADDLGPFTNPTLRLATEEDFAALFPLAVASVRERLARDPLAEDREGFEARVRQRIRNQRTYVLPVDGKLVFKVDVGSRSMHGAELEGLYTVPDERRRGHATLSLGQISRHLLSSLPRLTMRVDEQDPSLGGVARKVGYMAGRTQQLVVNG